MSRTYQRKHGFSLLEVLIATAIFMVVMVTVVGIFALNVGTSSAAEQTRVNSQSARFAFESITREVRLAHGLVYVDNNSNADLVIPPFEVVPDGANSSLRDIRIYQAIASPNPDSQGRSVYTLSRKTYYITSAVVGNLTVKLLKVCTQQAYTSNPQTADQLYATVTTPVFGVLLGLDAISWSPACTVAGSQSVLPDGLAVDQFAVIRYASYPAATQPLTTMSAQPFMELNLTVTNPRYNANKDTDKQIRTTLQTMIVPRNFLSPYEVAQPGVQGATQ